MEKDPLRKTLFAEFARRLLEATESNDMIPAKGVGQHKYICDEFERRGIELSKESVRRWFAGESRPRIERMRLLADILNVDEGWLSLGLKPDVDPGQKKARSNQVDGIVNVAVGAFTMNGATCSFPDDGDGVDFLAVYQGRRYMVNVALALEHRKGYKFHVDIQFADRTNIGVVRRSPFSYDFFLLPKVPIAQHGTRRGGYISVIAEATDRGLSVYGVEIEPLADLTRIVEGESW